MLFGCTSMTETRTRRVVDSQAVRLSEQRRFEEKAVVSVSSLRGSELELGVAMNERCLVVFGERETVRETVVRAPSRALMGLQLVGVGVGLGAFYYGADSETSDSSVTSPVYVGVAGLGVAVASAVGLAVTAKRTTTTHTDHDFETTDREERVAPCTEPPNAPRSIELMTDDGRRFLARVDGRGIARFRLPEDLWQAGPRVPVNVSVDGRPAPRLVLERR